MLEILKHRTYRHLFLAQVVALLGTGLATVALSLLAFDLAREQAGQVLGTAMAIKMVAYILVTPPPCFSACREFASPCSAGFSRLDPSLNSPGFAVRCGSLGSIYVNRCASVRIGCFYANVPVHHPGNTPG